MATFTSLDPKVRIPARLKALNMSHGFFSALCGENQMTFSRQMAGRAVLTGSRTQEYCKMLNSLEELAALFLPLRLEWSDAETLRKFLDAPDLTGFFSVMTDFLQTSVDEAYRAQERRERLEQLDAEFARVQEQLKQQWASL